MYFLQQFYRRKGLIFVIIFFKYRSEMLTNDYKESDLEVWLRKNHMSTNELCFELGCSRSLIWKVKRDMPISEHYAKRISYITKGEVNPKIIR